MRRTRFLDNEACKILSRRVSCLANKARMFRIALSEAAMEYYEGILILTTNHVASFDVAFKSRIPSCTQISRPVSVQLFGALEILYREYCLE